MTVSRYQYTCFPINANMYEDFTRDLTIELNNLPDTALSSDHELLLPSDFKSRGKISENLSEEAICKSFVQGLETQSVFVDESRRTFIRYIAPAVYRMSHGDLRGLGHCAVMVGPCGS